MRAQVKNLVCVCVCVFWNQQKEGGGKKACEFWLKQRKFLCSLRNNLKESVRVNSDERKHSLKCVGQLGLGLLAKCMFVMLGTSIGIVGGV